MQSAAKQVLGQEAMTFAPWHKHPICVAACREAGIFDADKQFFWHPDNANETISIDALTVDPSKLVEGLEGIWDTAEKTLEQPILETRLHNTRPGEAPDVQAWLVVSASSAQLSSRGWALRVDQRARMMAVSGGTVS